MGTTLRTWRMGDSNAVDVRRVADQIAARTGWLLVYRAPEANSGNDGQSTEVTYRQTKGQSERSGLSTGAPFTFVTKIIVRAQSRGRDTALLRDPIHPCHRWILSKYIDYQDIAAPVFFRVFNITQSTCVAMNS